MNTSINIWNSIINLDIIEIKQILSKKEIKNEINKRYYKNLFVLFIYLYK